jgi:hypothetical protein
MIDMQKRIETATVSLQKMAQRSPTDLGDVSAQITAEIDFSYSMEGFYRAGVVQTAVDRALALSLTGLDDDGIVPVTFFHHRVFDTIEATADTSAGLVQRFADGNEMGATNYSGPIERALTGGKKKRFGRKAGDDPSAPPFLHLFFTDGEPSDADRAERLLVQARTRPHFFQFIVFGRDPNAIRYVQKLNDDLTGPGVDNVGVTLYDSPDTVDDVAFFDDIVSEFFPVWLPAARAAGITN